VQFGLGSLFTLLLPSVEDIVFQLAGPVLYGKKEIDMCKLTWPTHGNEMKSTVGDLALVEYA